MLSSQTLRLVFQPQRVKAAVLRTAVVTVVVLVRPATRGKIVDAVKIVRTCPNLEGHINFVKSVKRDSVIIL